MFTPGVNSVDDEFVDNLFGEKTPGADNLLGGAAPKTEKTELDPAKKEEITPDLEDQNTDILFDDPDPSSTDDDPKSTKKEDKSKGTPKSTKQSALPAETELNYEAIYQDMVANGIWDEVEIPDGTEWNKDTFIEIQKLQTTAKYEDLLSRTGTYGKAIIEYEQNGGNPSELLDLFREQRDVREFDTSDSEGQEIFLRSYLEAQGYSEKSIDRTINLLKDQGGDVLKEEAEEKKAIWDEQYREVIENKQKEQALYQKQMREAMANFEKNITETLTTDPDATPKDRKELHNYMLNYSQNYNGKQVSQFYIDMAEVQKDPKNYVELAKFVKGLKNGEYVNKVAAKAKKEATVSSYLKIKNGAALGKIGGGDPALGGKGSDFITLLNRKK